MFEKSLLKGILYALGACLIWGLVFVIPQFMLGFNAMEIALGRYSFYGILSLGIWIPMRWKSGRRHSSTIWKEAFLFAFVGNILYYVAVVLSLRYACPVVCTLILGLSPITIAFYGNWKQKECSYKSLVFPSILILVGLIMVNLPQFKELQKLEELASTYTYIGGMLCASVSLSAWSWFVVANIKLLKENPDLPSGEWATLMGVATFAWVLLLTAVLGLIYADETYFLKYTTMSYELGIFLAGNAVLGILCAWYGNYLWNQASLRLPVSLAGQLTIFETIFGLAYVYVYQREFPPALECFGIGLMLSAIVYGIYAFSKAAPNQELA